MGILIRFVVTFASVWLADFVLPSDLFNLGDPTGGAIFAAVLALINAFIRPIVLLLTCPIQLVTLGLAALLINALLFLLAAQLAGAFGAGVHVGGFLGAFVAAIVVGLASWLVSRFVPG